MHSYVYMYVCVCAGVNVGAGVCRYVYANRCMCVCMYVCMYVCMDASCFNDFGAWTECATKDAWSSKNSRFRELAAYLPSHNAG